MQEPLEISIQDIRKTADLESLIEDKVARLDKLCNNLTSCNVKVSAPHEHQDSGSGVRVTVEVRVPPNNHLVSRENSSQGSIRDTPETVIRRAFEGLERQLTTLVEKMRESHRDTPAEEGPGIVIVIDHEKRFGIIKTVAGRDVYFNENAVLNKDFDRIEVGTAVRYEDEPGDEGPRATTVQVLEKKGRPIASSASA